MNATKYTLICEHSPTDKITVEFQGEGLDEVLKHIEYFMKGCSWVFRTGEELIIDSSIRYEPDSTAYGKKKRRKK